MHRGLNVNSQEDQLQTAERKLVNNLSWLRRFALKLLKCGKTEKESVKGCMQWQSGIWIA
jgi:hypothetical protein